MVRLLTVPVGIQNEKTTPILKLLCFNFTVLNIKHENEAIPITVR